MIPKVIKSKTGNQQQDDIPNAQWEDSRLLQAFVVGKNNAALRVIIQRYGSLVMAICRRATVQYVDAEDAFQATFLVFVKRASKIRNHQSLAGWLFQVARRTAVRARKRQQKERSLTVISDCEPISDQDLFSEIAKEFEAEQIDAILAELPAKYRDPLVMFHYKQMSVNEICEELNGSQGSIEGLLKRGRSELKIRLQRAGITLSTIAVATLLSQTQLQASSFCSASLIEQTFLTLTSPVSLSSPLPETIEHLAQQEWMPMLTNSVVAKSTLMTTAVLSIAILAGSSYVVGDPPAGSDPFAGEIELTAENADSPEQPASGGSFNNSTIPKADNITFAKPNSDHSKPQKAKTKQQREQQIHAKLQADTEVDFIDVPLSEAIEYLANLHGIAFRIDKASLDEQGITTDVPINLFLENVSLESVLDTMLEPLACDYIIKNEMLQIVSRDKADYTLEVQFYPIPQELSGEKNPQLIDFVMDMDSEGSYEREGGEGRIWIIGNSLAVLQTQRVHRKLKEFMTELEAQMEDQDGEKANLMKSDAKIPGGLNGGNGGGFF